MPISHLLEDLAINLEEKIIINSKILKAFINHLFAEFLLIQIHSQMCKEEFCVF